MTQQKYLITKTTKEPGVRELKRNTEHVISRFNLLRKTHVKPRASKKRKVDETKVLKFSFSIPDFKVPLELDEKIVDIFMASTKKEDMNPSVQRMYT
jgi:ATP-dependent Lon protease